MYLGELLKGFQNWIASLGDKNLELGWKEWDFSCNFLTRIKVVKWTVICSRGIHHQPHIFTELWWCHSGSQSCRSESHTSRTELQEDETTFGRAAAHPQDSPASELTVFLNTHALRDGVSQSHLIHCFAFFNYPSIFIESLLWAQQSGDLKVFATYWEFITKLGWSSAMKVPVWLKGKRQRGGKGRRRQEKGGEERQEEIWLSITRSY